MRVVSWFAALSAAILVMALLGGCDDGTLDRHFPSADKDAIRIIALDPPVSQVLSPGSTVDFSIGVKYASRKGSRLTLRISGAGEPPLPLVSERKVLSPGEGRVDISVTLSVPETASLEILAILESRGTDRSVIRNSRVYRIDYVPGTEI